MTAFSAVHRINAAPPNTDYFPYIYVFDSHKDTSFVVDSASPKSIVLAATYLDQVEGGSKISFLFASDGHLLEVCSTANLELNFEKVTNRHVSHFL